MRAVAARGAILYATICCRSRGSSSSSSRITRSGCIVGVAVEAVVVVVVVVVVAMRAPRRLVLTSAFLGVLLGCQRGGGLITTWLTASSNVVAPVAVAVLGCL